MATPNWDTLTILGVGLLGGSIGLAARKYGVVRRVIGWGRRPATLESALQLGAIDEGVLDLEAAVREAQLVVVCTPVETVAGMVLQSLRHMPSDAFITDVGSTKRGIVDQVFAANRDAGVDWTRFIPSHPLAGSERSGVEHAKAELFQDKTVIVTPTGCESSAGRVAVSKFWRALGARVCEQSPDQHDRTVSAISHLPHLIASLLAALTPDDALPFVASGWLDTTRIAAGDVELWRQIFAENRRHVGESLDEFIRVLTTCRDALRQGDDRELTRWLDEGKRKRELGHDLGN